MFLRRLRYQFGWELIFIFMFLSGLIYIYRGVLFNGKIIFPSNFLAQFFSPWSTTKFSGWENGIPHKPVGADQIRFFYPARTFTNELIKQDLPLWNPYIFAGNPLLADIQSAVLYPLNILYAFLPQINAWQILNFVQTLLASVFTYLYLRRVKLHRLAALIGSLAFGYSGFMVAWQQENTVVGHAAMWLPLILFSIEGYASGGKYLDIILGIFALLFSFLAGFFQITFYIYFFSLIYAYIRLKQKNIGLRTQIFPLIFFGIFPLLLAAVQLVPAMEGYLQSPRTTSSVDYLFNTYLLPLTHSANMFSPDIYGNPAVYNYFGRGAYQETVIYIGIVPLLFAIYALCKKKLNGLTLYYFLTSALTLFLIFDSPVTRWLYHLPVPLLSTFLPSRVLVITTFSISVLAALGFEYWLKNLKPSFPHKIISLPFLFLTPFIIYAIFAYFSPEIPFVKAINMYLVEREIISKSQLVTMVKSILYAVGTIILFFLLTLRLVPIKAKLLAVLILILFGQLYFLQKYVPIGEKQFLYPDHEVFQYLRNVQGFDRSLEIGGTFTNNLYLEKQIYVPEGLDPIFSRRYGQLVYAAMNRGRLTENIPRIEVAMSALGKNNSLIDNPLRLRLLSLLGVKHLLFYKDNPEALPVEEKFPQPLFIEDWKNGNWYGFRYNESLTRVMLVPGYEVINDPTQIINRLFDPDFNPKKSVILEEVPTNMKRESGYTDKASAQILSYKPSEVRISVDTPEPGMLVLSDTYYPGWEASVDGKTVHIFRANFTFRAIEVPAGLHDVVFTYEPESFKWGIIISSTAFVLVILFGVFIKRINQ